VGEPDPQRLLGRTRTGPAAEACRRPARVLFALVALVLATSVSAFAATWPGPPAARPPKLSQSGPPPAWIETHAKSSWLAYSSYCWKTTCADYVPPQSRTDLPVVVVTRGRTVRVHFAVALTQVHVTTFVRTKLKHATLRRGRTVNWTPTIAGVVSFDVRAVSGSASYVARVRIR
jgi:hypothetical protein